MTRRGAAIDLVLDRAHQARSQFVITQAHGREMIFWQSRQTAKQVRPNVALPKARAHGSVLDIVVDTGERYAWNFGHQQASVTKRKLPIGDYGIYAPGTHETGTPATGDDQLVATIERKSMADLASSLLSGKLTYGLAEMTGNFRAAVVVEAPYSQVFKQEYVDVPAKGRIPKAVRAAWDQRNS